MSETKLTYGVKIEEIEGDHVVTVRDLPEVQTSGDTYKEALQLAADATWVALEGRFEDCGSIPEPTPLMGGEIPMSFIKLPGWP